MSTQSEDYTALWNNPVNWRLYVFYFCREDPRLVIPKRLRATGWTMNFAHKQAYWLFAALLAIVLVPMMLVDALGLNTISWIQPLTLVLSILGAFALTWWAGKLRIK